MPRVSPTHRQLLFICAGPRQTADSMPGDPEQRAGARSASPNLRMVLLGGASRLPLDEYLTYVSGVLFGLSFAAFAGILLQLFFCLVVLIISICSVSVRSHTSVCGKLFTCRRRCPL